MRRASNSWLPVGILAILAAVSLWLKEVVDSSATAGRGRAQHHPDLIVGGFAVHQLGSDGHTRYTLSARSMTHFPDDDSSEFETVSLASFEDGAAALQVSADHGKRLVDQERVLLTGNVVVVRQIRHSNEKPLVMHTSSLDVYPDRKLSVAREPVRLDYGSDRLEAANMVFDNKLSIAEFTRVKATIITSPH